MERTPDAAAQQDADRATAIRIIISTVDAGLRGDLMALNPSLIRDNIIDALALLGISETEFYAATMDTVINMGAVSETLKRARELRNA